MSEPIGERGLARWLREGEIDARLVGLLGAVAAIWVALDVASDGVFLSPRNLYNLTVQTSVVGVMAAGMVLVIVARHIDLSVGSVLGFTGMTIAVVQAEWIGLDTPWSAPLSVAAGLVLGAAIGAWQGFWIGYRGVPAFVVTLGGLLIFRGLAYLLTDGRTVAPLDDDFARLGGGLGGSLGSAGSLALAALAIAAALAWQRHRRSERRRHGFPALPVWAEALRAASVVAGIAGFVAIMISYENPRSGLARGVPVPALILACVTLATSGIASGTRFGRYVFAMGGNPDAATLCGIDVRRVTLGLFVVMGVLCGIASVIATARLGAGTNSLGTLAELSVIAAAVIGGTSLAGGRGSVAGALLGALLMQSLENGMVLLGVSSALRQVSIGLVLIAAVWIDALARARRRS